MAGELVKGFIGKEDFSIQRNTNSSETFDRTSSTGGALTMTKMPDIWEGYGSINVAKIGHGAYIGTADDLVITPWDATHLSSGDYGQFSPLSLGLVHGSNAVPITDGHSSLSFVRYDDNAETRETAAFFFGLKSYGTIGVTAGGPAKDCLVAYAETARVTDGALSADNGIIGLVGVGKVLAGSNALATGIYGDAYLSSTTGCIQAAELCVRNKTDALAVGITAGGVAGSTIAMTIVGRIEGTSLANSAGFSFVAETDAGFAKGLNFAVGSIYPGGTVLDCHKVVSGAAPDNVYPLYIPNNSVIIGDGVAGDVPYSLIGIDSSDGIQVANAAPHAIVIGNNGIQNNPLYIWVGGALKNVTIDGSGFLKGV